LIQHFSADNRYIVINKNDGMRDHNYYHRGEYQKQFAEIWEKLRELKLAVNTVDEINNSTLFKFSPYKTLNRDQMTCVYNILENLDEAIANDTRSLTLIDGDAGTGKSITIMFLIKLLADLNSFNPETDTVEEDSCFGFFFEQKIINERFKNKRIAVVVPQGSLLSHVRKIFKKIDLGNTDIQFFSPIQFGNCPDDFDITIVEEGHLLKVGFTGQTGKQYYDINRRLFNDNQIHTELDWVMKKSRNVVMVFSQKQRVRPLNIDIRDVEGFQNDFIYRHEYLQTQMRSLGGKLFIDYIEKIFSQSPPQHADVFPDFELKLYRDFRRFVEDIKTKNQVVGLSRLIAGFSWEWKSKNNPEEYDIRIDGVHLRWNSNTDNWIESSRSVEEVGCIYTIQGEDLNYVGVIIGEELLYRDGKLVYNPDGYKDKGAKRRSMSQVIDNHTLTNEQMLQQILNVYKVLLSRSIKGTYVYVCDPQLREYLSQFFQVID